MSQYLAHRSAILRPAGLQTHTNPVSPNVEVNTVSTPPLEASTFERRTGACQERMRTQGVDLLILTPGPNMRYLTGFDEAPSERLLSLLVPAAGAPTFLVPAMYEDHVRRDAWVRDIRAWPDGENPMRVLARVVSELAAHPKRVAVDDRAWALVLLPLREVLDGRMVLASTLLSSMRMRKDAGELALLRRAAEIADQAFEWICAQPFEGQSERAIADMLERRMQALGGEGPAFRTLVASGPNGALPHHSAGGRVIARGDAVILDFGCRLGGYHSDLTRTVVCGEPSEECKRVHELVKRAQATGTAACRPGATAESVDRATRDVIAHASYGERFIHRTGHGLGLEPHEPPYLVAGDATPLAPGLTFSVEPGVYLPGKFGVRIEDIVAVTPDGVEPLNRCTHELRIVG